MNPATPSTHPNHTFNKVLRGQVVNPATLVEPTPYIHTLLNMFGTGRATWSRPTHQLQTGHELNRPKQLKMTWLCQWDIVARIPSPPERGYGRLNCGEPDYNYFVHRGGSRPMCMDALNFTCTESVQSFC